MTRAGTFRVCASALPGGGGGRGEGTEGKDEMGKRFAIVIGVAAAGVMALGPQTAAAAPDVVKYDTKLTLKLRP